MHAGVFARAQTRVFQSNQPEGLAPQEYEAFCVRCNGGKMVHHEPGIGSEETYAETLLSYERLFKEAPPRSIWGRAKVGETASGVCTAV